VTDHSNANHGERARQRSGRLPDDIRPGARVLFVGINPGLRSAALGHHFAGASNRFWKLLHESGLLPMPMTYAEDGRLPEWGYGITNLVARPTRGIDALGSAEYETGRRRLLATLERVRPQVVALLGITIYRSIFATGAGRARRREVRLGLQRETLCGARVFLLPNPSGRNAHVPYAEMLGAFRSLREYLEMYAPRGGGGREASRETGGDA